MLFSLRTSQSSDDLLVGNALTTLYVSVVWLLREPMGSLQEFSWATLVLVPVISGPRGKKTSYFPWPIMGLKFTNIQFFISINDENKTGIVGEGHWIFSNMVYLINVEIIQQVTLSTFY